MTIYKISVIFCLILTSNSDCAESNLKKSKKSSSPLDNLFIDTSIGKVDQEIPSSPEAGFDTPCLSSTSSVTIASPTLPILSPRYRLAKKFSPHFSEPTHKKESLGYLEISKLKNKSLDESLPTQDQIGLAINPMLPAIAAPEVKSRTPIINRSLQDHILEIAFEILDQEQIIGTVKHTLEIGLIKTSSSKSHNPFCSKKIRHFGITKMDQDLKAKIAGSIAFKNLEPKFSNLKIALLQISTE